MRAFIVAAGAAVALVLPGTAIASTQYFIPPGNSGGSEYVESVPGAGGNTPANQISRHGGGGSGSNSAVSKSTQSALVKEGSAGKQTAAFANQTGPGGGGQAANGSGSSSTAGGAHGYGGSAKNGGPGSGSGGSGGGGTSGGSAGARTSGGSAGAASGGSSPAVSVARSVTGLGGRGGFGLLPLALIAVVLGFGVLVLGRRRRHAS